MGEAAKEVQTDPSGYPGPPQGLFLPALRAVIFNISDKFSPKKDPKWHFWAEFVEQIVSAWCFVRGRGRNLFGFLGGWLF